MQFKETINQHQLFFILSSVLAIACVIFVWSSYENEQKKFANDLTHQGHQQKVGFQIAMRLAADNMLQVATVISANPRIKRIFQQSAEARVDEGGGLGGVETELFRGQLYAETKDAWEALQARFHVRQLHYHLPPGDMSFLRMHSPLDWGDDLSSIRHSVTTVMDHQLPVTGFELGRTYAGIRGVVPVFSPSGGGRQGKFIGVLEAGTAFADVIEVLKGQIGVDIAVLLNKRIVDGNGITPGFVEVSHCNCYVEGTTSNLIVELLDKLEPSVKEHSDDLTTEYVVHSDTPYAVTRFTFQDFLSHSMGTSDTMGEVVIWQDISHLQVLLKERAWELIYVTIGAFFVLELMLYIAVRAFYQQIHLNWAHGFSRMQQRDDRLAVAGDVDILTGLKSQTSTLDILSREVNRAQRAGRNDLTVLLLDVDYMKRINTDFGTETGDSVLAAIADRLVHTSRNYDTVGRYGGEEFLVCMPDTTLDNALRQAQRYSAEVAQNLSVVSKRGQLPQITCSIGAAQLKAGDEVESLIKRAMEAMYAAKRSGVGRVFSEEDL